jgi:hypothetical protein
VAQLRQLKQQFGDSLVIIGVHSAKFPTEKETANIQKAVQRLGIHHPVVNDAGFKIWNSYAVRAWPTLVLIDPRGRIVSDVAGEIQAEKIAEHIQAVLDEHATETTSGKLDLTTPPPVRDQFRLFFPSKVLAHPSGKLWITDTGNHRVLECTLDKDRKTAQVTRIFGYGAAGFVDGNASIVQFNHPHGLVLQGDPQDGFLYVADTENHAIRQFSLHNGETTTIAGTGQKAHGRFPLSKATQTALRSPWGLTLVENYLFIAMAGSHQIWVYDLNDQQLGIFAGNGYEALVDGPIKDSSFNQPSDLSFGLNHLFVADPEASAIRAITLTEEAKTITLVGQGLFDFGDVDGNQEKALLQHPTGIEYKNNQLFIADTYNHKIKTLDPFNGTVTTLAGTGNSGMKDGEFDVSEFYEPEGITSLEDLLILADTNNHLVRVLDLHTQQTHTLILHWFPEPQIEVPAIEVSSPSFSLSLALKLPENFEINPGSVTRIEYNEKIYDFPAGQEILLPIHLDSTSKVDLQLDLQYCQHGDTELCYQKSFHYRIPVTINPALSSNTPIELSLSVPV